ncbi:RNA polymerase sigma factor [Streptoalloteichus hindustanus]|uniref:RNA polymerase sigma factor n=1 Tax=Streptoalloteichus hindustanus TaxID=2017 RepID=A0A1M4VNJ4_STRHI|nr:RNA polymerase sigma factor [Streptoalloteichus hindustanus]SHE70382.1 RNA polymerase sigma-70 factor, ECF subfamily [Streptoalloteichus hindustanus]
MERGLAPTVVDDATLATRAAHGDIVAFETLLRRHSDRVLGLALRTLGDRAESEDVTQEVFVIAWRRLGELAEPAAVRTWLFRIAHRRCLAVLRQRRDRRTDPVGTLPEPGGEAVSGGAAADPARVAEASAGVAALRRALAGLPPPQRAVWLLAEVDGLSYAEIARVVGVSDQAVRGRLSRARASLAEAMRAWR